MTDERTWQNRITGHGEEDPEQLLAHPDQWRVHPQIQQDALAGVLDQVGWVGDVTVSTRSGHLVDGHLRTMLAMQRGEKRIPVTYVDLSEDEECLILATLDPLSAMAGTDKEVLAELLAQIEAQDGALAGLLDDLAKGAGLDTTKGGLTDPDDAPEPPKKPVTKPGDLWVLGDHRLLCGDATEDGGRTRLLAGGTADMVFTDPPYGISYLPQNVQLAALGHLQGDVRDEYGEWDAFRDVVARWCEGIIAVLRPGGCYYVCMGWEHLGHVVEAMRSQKHLPYTVITWDRVNPRMTSFPQGKRRGNGADGSQQTTLWRFQTMRAKEMVHTTQKPVELVENAVLNSSFRGELVADLFGGSGTTIVAAERTERRAAVADVDPAYCDVSVERWENFTGQKAVRE